MIDDDDGFLIHYLRFRALRLKCANAEWPDLYGHYREAKFTQTKHHWWWKANRIFDQLRATRDHDGRIFMRLSLVHSSICTNYGLSFAGLVLFLEEDHYVSEDFLPVLNRTEAEKVANCPNCDIICLGTYLKSYNYNRDHKTVSRGFRNARFAPTTIYFLKTCGMIILLLPASCHNL